MKVSMVSMKVSMKVPVEQSIKQSIKQSMRRSRGEIGWACSLGLIAALGIGCAGAPRPVEYDVRSENRVTKDGLHRVRFTGFAAVFVKPGASFGAYDRVMIEPLTVAYKSPPNPPDSVNRRRGNFALSEESTVRLKQIGRDALVREFSNSETFTVVQEAGPGVLRVSGHIVDLVVDAPPFRGGERDFISSAGQMTLFLDVRDSLTASSLTRTIDRREISPASTSSVGHFESTPVSIWSSARDLFGEWSRLFGGWLENLQQLDRIPPAPSA